MHVDQRRLREDIEANAEFGQIDAPQGRGRTVLTGSDADKQAREYFVDRLTEAGLAVRVDEVGNIAGRWTPASGDPDAAPIAVGSHLDSVPQGGIFDGPLGVYAALESVRAIQDADIELNRPVEIISFTEEEGARFSHGLLGSSVAAGKRPPSEALELSDSDGRTLRTHLENIGFHGSDQIDAKKWDAWLELHIEQGTKLESAGVSVGVVDAITGITTCEAAFEGEANHAGATPMFDRNDALTVASQFVLDFEQAAQEVVTSDSSTAVGTVGEFDVKPNARNIVPGAVELQMDIRDVKYESMNTLAKRAQQSISRLSKNHNVQTSFNRYRDQKPSQMSTRCVDTVFEAANEADVSATQMHSAAMHDTANVADVTDSVLLFAPSKNGISHNPREWTEWDDCQKATQVLAGAIVRLASQ